MMDNNKVRSSGRTTQQTVSFLVIKTNKVILHKETIDVCLHNHTNSGTGWNL